MRSVECTQCREDLRQQCSIVIAVRGFQDTREIRIPAAARWLSFRQLGCSWRRRRGLGARVKHRVNLTVLVSAAGIAWEAVDSTTDAGG